MSEPELTDHRYMGKRLPVTAESMDLMAAEIDRLKAIIDERRHVWAEAEVDAFLRRPNHD